MSSPNTDILTPAEYLAIERKAEIRSEYIAGRMYVMSGGSREHSTIAMNLGREISGQLLGRSCDAYGSDMRVKITPRAMYTYPDLSVACDPRFEDAEVDTLLNPAVIIEVLSDSTEAYDRGEKFAQYRRIDSLREYVLVAQKKMRVEHFLREGEQWLLSEISDPEARLRLSSIACDVRIADIYAKVQLNA